MKLNLPTTWTSQKIASLLLLNFLQIKEVKGGQAFANCIGANAYVGISSFSNNSVINSGQWLSLCCDNSLCSSVASNATCPTNNLGFSCVKIAQGTFCDNGGVGLGCAGIIGNTPVTTNTTLGTLDGCSVTNITSIANILAITPLANFTGISNGVALYEYCGLLPHCLKCFWDNNGWTCHSYANDDVFASNNASFNCYLQWPAPLPGSITSSSSILITSTTTSSILISSSSTSSFLSSITSSTYSNNNSSSNNPNLTPIVVPIGTVVGIGSIGGLTYYLIRRKRKQIQQSREEEIKLENLDQEREVPLLPTHREHSSETKNEVLLTPPEYLQKPDEQYQTYIEVEPSHRTGNTYLAK